MTDLDEINARFGYRRFVAVSPSYWYSEEDGKRVAAADLWNGDSVLIDENGDIVRYTFYLG
jgi:hypothetical protein